MEPTAIKSTEELVNRGIIDKDGNILAPMPLKKSTLKTWGICITRVYRPGEKDECSFITLNPDDDLFDNMKTITFYYAGQTSWAVMKWLYIHDGRKHYRQEPKIKNAATASEKVLRAYDEMKRIEDNPCDRIVIKWIDADGVKYETCLFFFPGFWK